MAVCSPRCPSARGESFPQRRLRVVLGVAPAAGRRNNHEGDVAELTKTLA